MYNEIRINIFRLYYFIFSSFYLCFCYFCKKIKQQRLRKIFFVLLSNIIKEDSQAEEIDTEIKFLFNKACDEQGIEEGNMRLLIGFIEKFIYLFTLKGEDYFKKFYQIDMNNERIVVIKKYLKYLESNNMFSTVPTKESAILKDMYKAIDGNNKDLGKTLLNQLAVEIERTSNQIEKQEDINKISCLVSIVGVILTIVFGISSFI